MKIFYKKTKYILVGIAVSLGLTNCSDDFLDTSPTKFIGLDDYNKTKEINPKLSNSPLSGIYSDLISTYSGGTKSHTDFGQKGYDIVSDLLSGDMALVSNSYDKYHFYESFRATEDNTLSDGYRPWRYYYKVIRSCNSFIDGFKDKDSKTEDEKHKLGQAKAIRAYAYFYLSQFYIKEYNAEEKVLPLLTKSDQGSVPQSETKEVYNQMVRDLNDAINLLEGFNRTAKHQVNQDIAKALLSYVYGALNTNESNLKAKELTGSLLNKYKLVSKEEALGGFNNIKISDWMWGFDLTIDMGFDLVSWWGQMDIYTYSYQSAGDLKAIDEGLFKKIPEGDIRKKQFLNDEKDAYYLAPIGKFYAPEKILNGQRNISTDYVFMRIAEMYLLNAEMAAKTGDFTTAKNSLKKLVEKRIDDVSYIDSLSNEDLLKEIYLQTRIELWGEGKSYLAMKRFKATIERGKNHLNKSISRIPYNDEKLTFKIPLAEIQNNPFIK